MEQRFRKFEIQKFCFLSFFEKKMDVKFFKSYRERAELSFELEEIMKDKFLFEEEKCLKFLDLRHYYGENQRAKNFVWLFETKCWLVVLRLSRFFKKCDIWCWLHQFFFQIGICNGKKLFFVFREMPRDCKSYRKKMQTKTTI